MNDDKVYTPLVIEDNPFPQEMGEDLTVSQSTSNGTFAPQTIKDQSFPDKRQALELISTALNTRSKKILSEFQFTPSGALQIGKYENGLSGDLRLSPAGIVFRNKAGINTLVADVETGSAIFAGELRSGSNITELLIVGNNSVTIDGESQRMLFYNNNNPEILIGEG